jgi:hypothetical protein
MSAFRALELLELPMAQLFVDLVPISEMEQLTTKRQN